MTSDQLIDRLVEILHDVRNADGPVLTWRNAEVQEDVQNLEWWGVTLAGADESRIWIGASETTRAALNGQESNSDAFTSHDELYYELLSKVAGRLAELLSPGSYFNDLDLNDKIEEPSDRAVRYSIAVELEDGSSLAFELALGPEFSGESRTAEVLASASSLSGLGPDARGPLLDIEVPVSVSLGRARMSLQDLLCLNTGSTVDLDRRPDDSVEIFVNDRLIGVGELVSVGGNYGVRIQQLVGQSEVK